MVLHVWYKWLHKVDYPQEMLKILLVSGDGMSVMPWIFVGSSLIPSPIKQTATE